MLSEELLELERRVDHIRLVCVDTAQLLLACQPPAARNTTDPHKRRVRFECVEYSYVHTLLGRIAMHSVKMRPVVTPYTGWRKKAGTQNL